MPPALLRCSTAVDRGRVRTFLRAPSRRLTSVSRRCVRKIWGHRHRVDPPAHELRESRASVQVVHSSRVDTGQNLRQMPNSKERPVNKEVLLSRQLVSRRRALGLGGTIGLGGLLAACGGNGTTAAPSSSASATATARASSTATATRHAPPPGATRAR